MRQETLAIGVVGLGRFIEIAHMPCYFESPYADRIHVAAVCDVNPSRLDEMGARYGIAARFTDVGAIVYGNSPSSFQTRQTTGCRSGAHLQRNHAATTTHPQRTTAGATVR